MAILLGILSITIVFSVTAHSFLIHYTKVYENNLQWLLELRFLLASILFVTIIQSLRSAKERELFRNKNISLQSEYLEAQLN